MTKQQPPRPAGGEANLNPDWEPGERPNRATDDWFETIGPEDMDPETKIEMLQEYGFDKQDQDEILDLPPTADYLGYNIEEGEDPDEVGDELYSTPVDAEDNHALRPVEDEAIEDLDEDEA